METCSECESTSDELVVVNSSFSDEFQTCRMCHDSMLANYEYTMCESCGVYFTYDHLIPNKDCEEKTTEICPYCGEIWCE